MIGAIIEGSFNIKSNTLVCISFIDREITGGPRVKAWNENSKKLLI